MSRLSQMLVDKLKECGKSERQVASEYEWSQQAFNTWKNGGVVPRKNLYPSISAFLGIPTSEVEKLCAIAAEDRPSKLPKLDIPVGIVSDRKVGKWKFPLIGGRRFPPNQYTIKVDTGVMEPAFHAGTKAIVDPTKEAVFGNEVMVHSCGSAWIGVLRAFDGKVATISQYAVDHCTDIHDVFCIHVITHSSRMR